MQVQEIKTRSLSWINIEKPTIETLDKLGKEYGFHELDLEDVLSKTESPKIEEYDDYVFVVFHFPVKTSRSNQFISESLNIFIGEKFFITLSNGKLKQMTHLFNELEENTSERRKLFKRGTGYVLYRLISDLFESRMPYLSKINKNIREIEGELFEGKIIRDRLFDILKVKRQIINLKRMILPHTPIIIALEHLHKRFIDYKLEIYFDDIADKIERSKTLLTAMSDEIDSLHQANESLLSHNTNRVIKILTIFSVAMLPLTVVTGIYGMNIALPLASTPEAFAIILGFMATVVVFMLVFFRLMRWV